MLSIAKSLSITALALIAGMPAAAQGQSKLPTPAQALNNHLTNLNRKVLEMAKDFPEDKYGYRPGSDVRSFADVILHITAGNTYAAKAGRGEKADWVELDAKNFKGKSEIVAALEKSITEANSALKATPEEQFVKTLAPWMGIIEHEAEHYGQLVAYYRSNGLIPPESRKGKGSN